MGARRTLGLVGLVCLFAACAGRAGGGDVSLQDLPSAPDIPVGDESADGTASISYDFHKLLPIPDEGSLADPHAIRVGDTWYLYGTHSQNGFEVWFSDDLAEWETGPTVWSPTLAWQTRANQCGMWAPHVEATETGYYLYYTANCRIGVARSDSPLGPFAEVLDVPLIGNGHGGIGDGELTDDILYDWDDMAIDAFLLERPDGELFLYFTALSPLSEIYAVPMADFATVAGAPTKLLAADLNSWEGFVREGAWVIEREGTFHLMYSGNQYDTLDYGLGVATATHPLGPFSRDPRNPLLKTNLATDIWGPGHHSVVAGAHDDLLLFYHTKLSAEQGEARRVRYGPLSFDGEGRVQVEQP